MYISIPANFFQPIIWVFEVRIPYYFSGNLPFAPLFYHFSGNKHQYLTLGLIPHFYDRHVRLLIRQYYRVNALSGLYLISTVPLQKPRFYAVSRACFCRYLSEYSDNSRFSCMLTFWTYLMRCTYHWHWIKYSTNYNRCHPIFFTLLISWAEQ